jgi:hypothetical protein
MREADVELHSFLISGLDGSESSPYPTSGSYPGKKLLACLDVLGSGKFSRPYGDRTTIPQSFSHTVDIMSVALSHICQWI